MTLVGVIVGKQQGVQATHAGARALDPEFRGGVDDDVMSAATTGGAVMIESASGQGTRVTCRLPVAQPTTSTLSPSPISAA